MARSVPLWVSHNNLLARTLFIEIEQTTKLREIHWRAEKVSEKNIGARCGADRHVDRLYVKYYVLARLLRDTLFAFASSPAVYTWRRPQR